MKRFWVLLVHFATLVASQQNATKQEQLDRALELLQTMPQCAVGFHPDTLVAGSTILTHLQVTCLAQALAASGASLGNLDLSASCQNETNAAIVEGCVRESCIPREQLSTLNILISCWQVMLTVDHNQLRRM